MREGDPLPWANGYVLARMSHEGKTFQVHIDGEHPWAEDRFDFAVERGSASPPGPAVMGLAPHRPVT